MTYAHWCHFHASRACLARDGNQHLTIARRGKCEDEEEEEEEEEEKTIDESETTNSEDEESCQHVHCKHGKTEEKAKLNLHFSLTRSL
jgi:hypothetical protein